MGESGDEKLYTLKGERKGGKEGRREGRRKRGRKGHVFTLGETPLIPRIRMTKATLASAGT